MSSFISSIKNLFKPLKIEDYSLLPEELTSLKQINKNYKSLLEKDQKERTGDLITKISDIFSKSLNNTDTLSEKDIKEVCKTYVIVYKNLPNEISCLENPLLDATKKSQAFFKIFINEAAKIGQKEVGPDFCRHLMIFV